jgi:predicted transcriptional regulator
MATTRTIRRSISLPAEVDNKIQKLARRQKRSANQVYESLIETGLAAREAEKRRFFELTERLRATGDPAELRRLKDELARMTFGD